MRCLLYVSFIFVLTSCSIERYKSKQTIPNTQQLSIQQLQPQFDKLLYRCNVSGKIGLKKFRLSGVLYLKKFENDGTTRVVFQSEMGVTFFDFGWNKADSFQVFSIMPQMDKPALIKTLRKDFEMLLAKGFSDQPEGVYQFNSNNQVSYFRFNLTRGFVYFLLNTKNELTGIENADDKQKVTSITMTNPLPLGLMADEMQIEHHKAGFTIDLKKINSTDEQDVAEE